MTEALPNEYFQVPSSARIWNYWMGGKDNYPVDREAGDAWVAVHPEIVNMARESRRFLIRAVRYLAGAAGVRQFLDVGTGLPTMQNTHEVAQSVAPECRIVYVDNDPIVLAHARALLVNTTPEGRTTYLDADYHDPERILAGAGEVLDFDEPVAVMFMGSLGHVPNFAVMRSIVERTMASVPAGSYLAMYDGTSTNAALLKAEENYEDSGATPYVLRDPAQLAECFAGLELVEPGLVPITEWRPELGVGKTVDAYGAVARKP